LAPARERRPPIGAVRLPLRPRVAFRENLPRAAPRITSWSPLAHPSPGTASLKRRGRRKAPKRIFSVLDVGPVVNLRTITPRFAWPHPPLVQSCFSVWPARPLSPTSSGLERQTLARRISTCATSDDTLLRAPARLSAAPIASATNAPVSNFPVQRYYERLGLRSGARSLLNNSAVEFIRRVRARRLDAKLHLIRRVRATLAGPAPRRGNSGHSILIGRIATRTLHEIGSATSWPSLRHFDSHRRVFEIPNSRPSRFALAANRRTPRLPAACRKHLLSSSATLSTISSRHGDLGVACRTGPRPVTTRSGALPPRSGAPVFRRSRGARRCATDFL